MFSQKTSKAYVELLRPYNIPILLFSFSMGYFFLGNLRFHTDFFWGILIIILAHSFATVQNDIQDFEIDSINSPKSPLQQKIISLSEAKRLQIFLGLFLILVGLVKPIPHILFGSFALIISWVYNNTPFQLSRKPIWSIVTLGVTNTILPMAYGFSLNNDKVNPIFLTALVLWFFIRISISVLKDYKDTIGDKKLGKKTFYLVFGNKVTSLVSIICSFFAYIGIFWISLIIRPLNWILLLPLVLAIYTSLTRIKLLSAKNEVEANKIFFKVFSGENQFEALYLLWLVISSI